MPAQPSASPAAPPRLAITMGDPAGVGPEVAAAVWRDPRVWVAGKPVVFGSPTVMREAVRLIGVEVEVMPFENVEQAFAASDASRMPCVSGVAEDLALPKPGVVTAATGEAAFAAIAAAADLAMAGGCEAIVTGPISKAALQAAGHDYPGHTELLADRCGAREFAMMLYLPPVLAPKTEHGIGVIHVTLHTALRRAIESLSVEGIVEKCRLAHDAAVGYGVAAPRIGVAALNPHAGEGGLFGDEELRLIAPAVEAARGAGIDASGPHPVDTLMVRAVGGEFDAVVAMYHDQGHIALKLLGMHGAVNITLGLPIVRTSVAHGTAPDLAWQGVAETGGMIAAIEAAARLSCKRP